MNTEPIISLLIFFSMIGLGWWIYASGIWKYRLRNAQQKRKDELEDVLKQLYHVEYSGRKASLNAMAGALKMKDSKLVSLIEHMTNLELIRVEKNMLHLTEQGKDYALNIIRVHRLWEKYLSEKTGIHKSEWHERAERMEHNLTPEQTEILYQELGSPRFDPHGDPIPLKSGEIIQPTSVTLCGVEPGSKVKITHIEDEPKVIYKQIIDKKLHIGQQLKVVSVDDQNIEFDSEGHSYKLSTIVASNIGVKKLSPDETFEGDMIRLSGLQTGEKARVLGISRECRGANRRRLLDLGVIKGSTIETGFESPSKEPRAYIIKNSLIALRNDQAELILIEKTE